MKFFQVTGNSVEKNWYASVETIISGLTYLPLCEKCGRVRIKFAEKLIAKVSSKKNKWPDWLDCPLGPSIILSERVLETWKAEKVGEFPARELFIEQPITGLLKKREQPKYFWVETSKIAGIQLDWEASRYFNLRCCVACRELSYDRDHFQSFMQKTPLVLINSSWNGANLFTAEGAGYIFCTEALVKSAARQKFTNFRFVPVEEGDGVDVEGIDYLNLMEK